MDMKNVSPSPHESEAQAAKWYAIGRIAALWTLPTIAFLALLIKLVWPQLQQSAPYIYYFLVACLLILVTGGMIGFFLHIRTMSRLKAERYQHNTYRFQPDVIGNFEAVFDQDAKTFIQAMPGNYQQPVYQTYSPHYAPVFEYKDSSQRMLPEASPNQQFQTHVAPSIEEVVQALPHNGLQLSLGRSLTSGEFLTIGLKDEHLKLIGGTRKGKSSLAGGLLEEIQRTHDPNVLQFALLDLEYKTSRLFERSSHVAYLQAGRRGRVPAIAREASEVAMWLKWMYQEMDRRYKMTAQQLKQSPYLLIYIEEFLGLRRHLKGSPALGEALNYFTLLATQSLKANMSLLICAQVDYSSEELREAMAQFVGTNVSFSVKPDAARAAGFISTELLNRNYAAKTPGQFVVEGNSLTDIGVSPQYDVRQKLNQLDGVIEGEYSVKSPYDMPAITGPEMTAHPQFTHSENVVSPSTTHPQETAWQAYLEQVWTLYNQGYRSIEVLIEKVFGIKKGGYEKWYSCRDIVRSCLEEIKRVESENQV
jgi:FtsK/SpoIIIE family